MKNELEKWSIEWKTFYKNNQALMDGALLYTVLLILVFIILVGILKIPEASVTGAGQFFADWLLFPTVVIGFWIAIREFRQSQVAPKLEISLFGDRGVIVNGDTFILRANSNQITSYRLSLHVHNTGELVTIWYRIAIDLPAELLSPFEAIEEDENGYKTGIYKLRWHLGDNTNWGDNLNMQRRQYDFKSNGQHALYPEQSVHIATLEVTIPAGYIQEPRQGQIKYSIVTDKTKIVYKEQGVILNQQR